MKSEHRHELETNSLARYLTRWIEGFKPYAPFATFGIIAILVGLLLWTWMGKASASRQTEAWSSYVAAMEGVEPNLDLLKKASEEHAGTPVGELAELTWADGQLFAATQTYLVNKSRAGEQLDSAVEKYESIIDSFSSTAAVNRARFGLGRAYEMRNELDKAQAEYAKVTGPFEALAKQRIERLKSDRLQATFDWLAKAEGPRTSMPTGPGALGARPEFQVDELATPPGEAPKQESFDDILKRLGDAAAANAEGRYEGAAPGAGSDAPQEGQPSPEFPAAEPPDSETSDADVPVAEQPQPPSEPPATEAEDSSTDPQSGTEPESQAEPESDQP